jgi:autotransporter-associated beta strand protein
MTASSKTITKLGAGRLAMSANNTHATTGILSTSNFDLQAGVLVWGHAGGVGNAVINLNGGNLDSILNQNTSSTNNIHNWNANWSWLGTNSTFYIGAGAVTLGASTVQVTVDKNELTIGGIIGDGGNGRGLTKAGIGTLVLNGANTYTGTTTVSGGVLRLFNTTSLAGGIGASGGTTALTINDGVVELAANDFSRDLGAGASQFRITGGASGFSSHSGQHNVTINNDADQEVQWGSTHFTPTALVLNDTTANDRLVFQNRIDLNGAGRTINVNANIAEISGNIRTATGTAGLVKGGAGTLVLSGANTYNGTTTVNAGVLSVAAPANVPGYNASGNVVFNGGTVRVGVGGSGWTTGQVDTLLSNATKTGGAIGIDTSSGNLTQWTAFTDGGNFGALGLEKSGSNTLTLNQVNNYTGATILSGGTLEFKNSTGLTQGLTGGLNIAGPDVTILSDYNSGSGTLSTTFGALTRTTGSTVNISVTGGTPGTNNLVNLTGAAGFVNAGVFYNGSNFAWRDSADGPVRAPNYGVDAGTAVVNTLTANAHVKITSTGLGASAGTTTYASWLVDGSGLTFDQTSGAVITPALVKTGGGTFTFNNANAALRSPTNEIVIRTEGITDEIIVQKFDNPYAIVKSGAGTLTFTTATNFAIGDIYVNGGTFQFTGAGTMSNSTGLSSFNRPIFINSGANFLYNSTNAKTLSGGISGGGNLTHSNTGALTLAAPNTFSGTTTNSGGILILGNSLAIQSSTLDTANSAAGTSTVGLRISNGITNLTLGGLNGNKNFASGGVFSTSSSNYGNITALTLNPAAGVSNTYSGAIANGASNMTLTKTGQGTQILSGTNTYTGSTTINAGTLALGHATNTLADSGAVNVNGGTLDIGVNSDTVGAVTLTSGSITGGTGVLTGSSYAVHSGTISGILGGSGALTKNTSGTFTLTSAVTYTGQTDLNEGTTWINGSTSSSSAVTVASGATLGGDGTVGGSATFNNGSKFGWNLSVTDPSSTGSATVSDTLAVTGALVDGGDAGGSVFKIVLAGTQTFADTFWNASHTWNNVLTSGNSLDLGGLFDSFSFANASGTISGPTTGSFSLSGSTLSFDYTVIPEPTTALGGLLLTAGLLRRRRALEDLRPET